MRPPRRRVQAVLGSVVALQLVAETALTPYWPLLFRRLFSIQELAATGSFLALCRVAGLLALPLWGVCALRWPVRTLLVTGLTLSAVFDLALAVAPSWWTFAIFSAGAVASGSVLVLAYPALVALTERPSTVDRRTGVITFWTVFHASAVLATMIGAGIVALSEPRWGLAAFALVDLLLATAVLALVPAEPVRRRRDLRRPVRRTGRWRRLRPWFVLVLAVVGVDAALAIPRPYFVELLLRQGVAPGPAGWLFLAPAIASLAVLPVTPRLLDRLGGATAPVCAVVGGLGLAVQAVAAAVHEPLGVLAGRLLFGASTGILLVVLDLTVFDRIGTSGAAFSGIETGRSAALLSAPIVATAVAGAWLGAPLIAGALLLFAAGILLTCARSCVLPATTKRADPVSSLTQEIEHDFDTVN